MPLTGSDVAYKQARSAIARAGATRSGFFTPNVVITINSVNRSSSVIATSLHVSLVLNDEPDTASFTLKPGATIPTVGQTISIALGSSSNPIFAGQIARVVHRRRKMPGTQQSPFVDVDCIDWTRLFDKDLVNNIWSSESASDVITELVAGAPGFTDINVEAGLPTIDYVAFTNEKRSAAIRRVINLMGGGGFYISPDKDVHAFGAAGETTIGAPTNPLTLTNTSASLLAFTHGYDYGQVRNRVICEYRGTTPLIPLFETITDFPVDDASTFTSGFARFGPLRHNATAMVVARDSPSALYGAVVNADTAAGSSTLVVLGTPITHEVGVGTEEGWINFGSQFIRFDSWSGTGPYTLAGIVSSGVGSITEPLRQDDQGAYCDVLAVSSLPFNYPVGAPIVPYVDEEDAASIAAIAAIEGGDGIHEHVISDGRLNEDGATLRALADLESFSDPLTHVTYQTDDMNARPGAQQAITLTTTDAFSGTLTITQVDLSFPIQNYRPTRRCEASTVRLARFADITETEAI